MKRVLSLLICLMIVFIIPADMSASASVSIPNYDEAQALYENFLDSISHFGETENDKMILDFYDDRMSEIGELYTKATYHPANEYYNMSRINRYIWYVVYLEPLEQAHVTADRSGWMMYEDCKTKPNYWNSMVINYCANDVSYCGEDAVEAYHKLMEWSGEFYLNHHDVYNFMEKKSYLDYVRENDIGYTKDTTIETSIYYADQLKHDLEHILDRYIVNQSYDKRVEAIAARSTELSEVFARASNRPAEDYLEMTNKDQYYAYITYVGLYEDLENVTDYNASFQYWYDFTCFRSRVYAEIFTDEFMEKYAELMQWQYEYYMTNHKLYDFGYKKQNTTLDSNEPGDESISEISETESIRSWEEYDSASIAAARERDKPKKQSYFDKNSFEKITTAVIWEIVLVLAIFLGAVLFVAKINSGKSDK